MLRFAGALAILLIAVSSALAATPVLLPAPPPNITQTALLVASDGTDFLATWAEYGLHAPSIVRAARISHSGVLLDQSAVEIGAGYPVGVAFGGGVYLVLWYDQSGLVATRVKPSGERVDDFPLRIANSIVGYSTPSQASVVFDGRRFFVTWADLNAVLGMFVTPQLIASATQTLATRPQDKVFIGSSVAWDGHRFLVVWSTSPIGTNCVDPCIAIPTGVVALRVAADGTPLDGAPTQIATAIVRSEARVASSGHDFMITLYRRGYESMVATSEVRAIIVDAETSIAVRASVKLSNWFPWATTVIWNGSDYEVAWSNATFNGGWAATARIDRAGNVLARRLIPSGGGFVLTLAANDLGDVMIGSLVRNATATDSVGAVYFDRDLTTPLPAPPPAPLIGLSATSVVWSGSAQAEGYIVENADTDEPFAIRYLKSSEQSITIANLTGPTNVAGIQPPKRVRVRAWNVGGFSEPSATVPAIGVRSRAARH
jgi:hypothetical protein